LGGGNVSKGFGEVHGEDVARDETAPNEFGDKVESNLNTGDGGDDGHGIDEYKSEGDTQDDDGGDSTCLPYTDIGHTKSGHDGADTHVPPCRDFFVCAYESPVDILGEIRDVTLFLRRSCLKPTAISWRWKRAAYIKVEE